MIYTERMYGVINIHISHVEGSLDPSVNPVTVVTIHLDYPSETYEGESS